METLSFARVAWAVGTAPHPGERVTGDAYLAESFPGGFLLAAVDGVGHGAEAAAVAARCVSVLSANAWAPVGELIHRCHEKLRGTRGATLSVASFETGRGEMSWAVVGNVAGIVVHADSGARPREELLLPRAGLLGTILPPLQVVTVPMADGDVVILATDGVGPGFQASLSLTDSPQTAAHRILEAHGRRSDDALVVVGRYVGVA
jgi:negative regulator of sigma-B (phosphoserine phosphatase)